jgi:purine nucleosidase
MSLLNFPVINTEKRIRRLQPKAGKIRMVLDTDTFNEIDDQFALSYTLLSSDRISLEAVYAAPFYNELSHSPGDGMEKSYQEILRILQLFGVSSGDYAFRGCTEYLRDYGRPTQTDAALDLIERAMGSDDDEPLYVVSIGAITNIASAILLEPRIIEKIVLVWLGGHARHWPTTREFNLEQDILASRLIFDCGIPLVQIPCMGVTSHLLTTLTEIREYVKGRGAIGDFLYETFANCSNDHFGYSRVIWDISTIAYLINPEWVSTQLVHSPILTDQVTWSFDESRHLIRYASSLSRDRIFRDLFEKIAAHHAAGRS